MSLSVFYHADHLVKLQCLIRVEGVEALLTDIVVVQVRVLGLQVVCEGFLRVEVHTGTKGTDILLTIVSGCLVDHSTYVLDEAIVGFPFLILW